MENYSGISGEDEQMELPPGFRFHPTDEELITHYLSQKVLNRNFSAVAIGEADLNKVEPWDLPMKAKMGEKEWYFFVVKDRKYPTGLRTNRATEAGYWKATGKDKEIYRAKALVGMKKTLVFYTGRAPKGEKTNWIMHEYRLEGKYSKYNLAKTAKNEWVLSRVFKKSLGGRKPTLPGFVSLEDLQQQPFLPPLMDSSPYNSERKAPIIANPSHVTCFSAHHLMAEEQKVATIITTAATTATAQVGLVGMVSTTNLTNPCSSSPFSFASKSFLENTLMEHSMADFQYTDSVFMQDQSILRLLLQGKGSNLIGGSKVDLSLQTGFSVGDMNTEISPISNHDQMVQTPSGPIDLDCLWDY